MSPSPMRLMWLFLASILFASAPAQAAPEARRIVAVGDLHGDWEAWMAIARSAGLVDRDGLWTGGRTILVQIGDIADRGPDSLRIIRHLRALQDKAPRSGGEVIVLVGNHEAMNMIGDLRYVHPGEYAAFADRLSKRRRDLYFERNRSRILKAYRAEDPDISEQAARADWQAQTPLGKIEHRRAWHPSGEIGRWVLSNPAAVKLGDTLFVHAGLSAEYAALPLEEINRRVAAALKAQDRKIGAVINDPLGPLWYRGHVTRSGRAAEEVALATDGQAAARPGVAEELEAVLAAQGARRIVVGHTPVTSGIAVSHGGRLVRIDTGISRHYGGQPSYLEIEEGRLTAHRVERPQQRKEDR